MATDKAPPPSNRQRLGEVIKFQRENFGKDLRRVAQTCGASISDVEAWERGSIVPNSSQWMRLKTAVSRNLHAYGDLYQRARTEETAERQTITRSIEVHSNGNNGTNGAPRATSKIGTSLGDKIRNMPPLVPAQVASSTMAASDSPTAQIPDARTVNPGQAVTYQEPAPSPTPSRMTRSAPPPPGWKAMEAVMARREFALNVLRQRPAISVRGADSLDELLVQRFGVGISSEAVTDLRAQVQRERAGLPIVAPAAAVAPPAPRPEPEPTREVNGADLEAAVQLVLGAVPNLRTFSISIDEDGSASVDYTVREVVVRETAGSLKVRRS